MGQKPCPCQANSSCKSTACQTLLCCCSNNGSGYPWPYQERNGIVTGCAQGYKCCSTSRSKKIFQTILFLQILKNYFLFFSINLNGGSYFSPIIYFTFLCYQYTSRRSSLCGSLNCALLSV